LIYIPASSIYNYFVNIGNDLSASIPLVTSEFSLYPTGSYINSFAFYPTDSDEVFCIGNSLPSMGSFGSDDILLNNVKCCIEHIVVPISNMINLSLTIGCFPNQLKFTKICPPVCIKLMTLCLQKRALHLIMFSPYRTASNSLLPCLKILKLYDINKLQIGLFMFLAQFHRVKFGFKQNFLVFTPCYII